LWYLHQQRVHLVYGWQDFWRALIGLLDFLANKLDGLITTGGVEQLVEETLHVLDIALCSADNILPTPRAIHEMIYEIVRSSAVFRKTKTLLEKLAPPRPSSRENMSAQKARATDTLTSILTTTDHYEEKIREANAHSANSALRAVGKEVDKDGVVYGRRGRGVGEPEKQPEEVVGFIRYAYSDGMALMP